MDEEDWDADIALDKTPTAYKPPSQQQNTFSQDQKSSFGSYRNNDDNKSSGFNSYSSGRGRLIHSNRDDNNNNNNNNNNFGFKSSNFGSGYNRDTNDQSSYKNRTYSSSQTETLTIETRSISSIIGKSGSNISGIKERCNVKIYIPPREEIQGMSQVEIKITGSNRDDIQKAKDMIKASCSQSGFNSQTSSYRDNQNRFGFGQSSTSYNSSDRSRSDSLKRNFQIDANTTEMNEERSRSRENKRSFEQKESSFGFGFKRNEEAYNSNNNNNNTNTASSSSGGIDWEKVRAAPTQSLSKFKDHPPVVKDFYVEDPEIKTMSRDEVKQFRKENFNIIVDVFKKEIPYWMKDRVKEDDEMSIEEKDDFLFGKVPNPVKTIEQAFRNYPEILDECKRQNFIKPTPIQSQLWPILLKGLDCIGIAQTGTGKTLAFLLPALIHIDNQPTPREKRVGPNVLVLSPTRELAIQIEQEVKKINYKGIKSVVVYGGGDRNEQANVCTKGVQIIIATPGRLYDLVSSGIVNITSVTFLVLDEADRMLDLGFEPQIMKLLLDIRPDRQTVMTSATWPEGVRRLATKYLNEPIQLYVGTLDLRAAKTVRQLLEMVESDDLKNGKLMNYIENEMTEYDKVIVFVGRKSTADNLSCDLIMKNIQCQSIHGDRQQCDREEALEDFKEGRVRILIATDVASRGIDVNDVTCVINYDFPRNIEDYVHRVGRTGRAGRKGTSITYVAREDWKHAKELIEILKQGEQEVPQSLVDMAERYDAMLKRKAEEGGFGRGGGGRRFGNRDGFGGGGGNSSGSFNPSRGRRGRDYGGTSGFVF